MVDYMVLAWSLTTRKSRIMQSVTTLLNASLLIYHTLAQRAESMIFLSLCRYRKAYLIIGSFRLTKNDVLVCISGGGVYNNNITDYEVFSGQW